MLTEVKTELENLKSKILDLKKLLSIDDKKAEHKELQIKTSDPSIWEDREKAQTLFQRSKSLESQINKWENLYAKSEDLLLLAQTAIEEKDETLEKELAAEKDEVSREFSDLETLTLLGGEYDKGNAILSINAGAGGTDSQDWAQILLRMYSRWAEDKGYKVEAPDISYGEGAGIKNATLLISGDYAYGQLKCERGIHRLVRISPFSSEGKRHTSFTAVEVIPEITEDIKLEINPSDLRIDTFRASGPGGQHVNKTDSAIRITHIPTNTVTQSQSARSQHQNKEAAIKILKAKLYERLLQERKEKIEELRGAQREIGWGNQIRSYVFHPYTMVKDHRTSTETGNVQKVIDGDINMFIEACLRSKSYEK
ncbi:peptide chain release factor 2 [Candidatus Margulisiibacteriota bacterium]